MDKRNLITKIALGTAALAFVFALITLIRAVILGAGVLFAAIQVIGTLIIAAICAVMLYVLGREEGLDEETEESAEGGTSETTDEAENDDGNDEKIVTSLSEKYHLDDFE